MRKPYIFFWIIVVLVLIIFWVYLPIFSRYRELKLEEERIGKEINTIDAKIKALEEERGLLKDDMDYLEKMIRQEFGLVKPGEIIYRFITRQKEEPVGADALEASRVAETMEAPPIEETKVIKETLPAVNPEQTPAASAANAAVSKPENLSSDKSKNSIAAQTLDIAPAMNREKAKPKSR